MEDMERGRVCPRWAGAIEEHRGWFIALGIALIALGMVAIFLPLMATLVTTLFIGWLLVLGGAAQAIHALQSRPWRGHAWEILSAILSVIAGVLLLLNPLVGTLTLTLILGIFFFAEGALKLVRAFQHRESPSWGWLLFDGIVTAFLGILILARWPGTAVWAIGLLVGIDLLMGGWSMVMLTAAARSLSRARV